MQNQIRLIITSLAFFSWACSTKNTVLIEGKIMGDEISRVEYAIPINGTLNPFMTDTLKTDSLGNFQIEIPFQKAGFIFFRPFYHNKPTVRTGTTILAEPGEKYYLVIDPAKEENNFTIKGKYAIANYEYNKLPGDVLFSLPSDQLMEYAKDSVANSIINRITETREKEISMFKEMAEKGDLSKDLLKLVEADRYCFYNALMTAVVSVKYSSTKNLKSRGVVMTPELREMYLYTDEMIDVWKSSFVFPGSLNTYFSQSPWWYTYQHFHIGCNLDGELNQNPEKTKELTSGEFAVTNRLNTTAKLYVPDEMFETYFANELSFESALFGENSYEILSLYDQFVNDYPNSEYTPYLTPYFEKLRDYHRKSLNAGFGENVNFVDGYQGLNTLAKCIAPFNGKKVYVDVWATWCAPCRAEFLKKETLEAILEKQDIEMLYISIDGDGSDKAWKDFLKYYEPAGNHLRANQQLVDDLRKVQHSGGEGSLGVPYHIMFDENGNQIDFPQEIKEYLELSAL